MDSRYVSYKTNTYHIPYWFLRLLSPSARYMLSVCVLKNWKQLFLSKLILYLLGQE